MGASAESPPPTLWRGCSAGALPECTRLPSPTHHSLGCLEAAALRGWAIVALEAGAVGERGAILLKTPSSQRRFDLNCGQLAEARTICAENARTHGEKMRKRGRRFLPFLRSAGEWHYCQPIWGSVRHQPWRSAHKWHRGALAEPSIVILVFTQCDASYSEIAPSTPPPAFVSVSSGLSGA